MAITDQLYVPDRGRVTINSTEVSGSVKTIASSAPRRTTREVHSLGGKKTESQDRVKAGDYEYSLEVYDDQSLALDANSLLTVLHTAYENNTPLTDMAVAPAGSEIGMVEYTFGGSIHVVQCQPHADSDAETDEEGTVQAVITTETIAVAAIIA